MPISDQKRKPKYRRQKDAFNVRILPRDEEIIRQVMKHRLMTSEHIAALIGGSRYPILRRLQKLFHAGYLDRPPEQILASRKEGSSPMVYAPGNEGQRLLAGKLGVPIGRLGWTEKNRQIRARFLAHTLQVTGFMVALEVACRQEAGIELIPPEGIIRQMSDEARKARRPLIWQVSAKVEENRERKTCTFSMEPDGVFGLRFRDLPEGRNRTHFFLEADQGTMPLRAGNMHRSSIFKKMVGYFASWEQGLYGERYPFRKARVIFLAASAKRIGNMLALQRELDPKGKGLGIFLFINQDVINLENPGILLGKVFMNGRGERVSLVD